MKPLLIALVGVSCVGASVGFATEQTLTGVISDSLCGASHAAMAGQVTPSLSDADCTRACVDAQGKFVLVDDSKKVVGIANQSFSGLRERAGQKVKVTGDVKDGMVTITRMEGVESAKK